MRKVSVEALGVCLSVSGGLGGPGSRCADVTLWMGASWVGKHCSCPGLVA